MRHTSEDYYAVLGVDPSASDDAIKAAFRAHAKVLHPDKNRQHDSTAAFQRVQEAYAVLGDPMYRKLYDIGRAAPRPHAPSWAPAPAAEATPELPRRRIPLWTVWAATAAVVATGGLFAYRWQSSPPPLPPDRPAPAPRSTPTPPSSPADRPAGMDPVMQAAIDQYTRNYAGREPATTSEVEMEGKNGRRYVLAVAIAKQLEPTHSKLVAAVMELNERGNSLKERHDSLERDHRALNPSEQLEVKNFNEKAEALNRDVKAFMHDLEAHNQEADAFYAELERVALRSH